jgi:hypothetical protein
LLGGEAPHHLLLSIRHFAKAPLQALEPIVETIKILIRGRGRRDSAEQGQTRKGQEQTQTAT